MAWICLFFRRRGSDVRGSAPGNTGHGVAVWDGRREEQDGDSESGLSSPWQTSLTVNHMQPVCAQWPPTQQAGCAAYTEVHCGSGSCSNRKGWGVSGLHAQPSQWRSFREAGRCLFMKGGF